MIVVLNALSSFFVTENFLLSPLRARKSDNYRYHDSLVGDNYRESKQEKKQITITKNETMKRGTTSQGAIEEINTLFRILFLGAPIQSFCNKSQSE